MDVHMKKNLLLFILLVVVGAKLFAQDTLVIQENALGLCTYDGTLMTNLTGWTGPGYIDMNSGKWTSISWEILIPVDGTYSFTWRYSFGGEHQPTCVTRGL
jgi:pectate lyase